MDGPKLSKISFMRYAQGSKAKRQKACNTFKLVSLEI